MRKWTAAAVVALAGTALLAAAAMGAFTDRSASAKVDAIAIAGEWEITIKNPDGSVAGVHRFHNEFNGAQNVARILAHVSSPGRYWMTLVSSGGTPPCGVTGPEHCLLFEADDPNGGVAGWFDTVTAEATSGNQLVVRGEIFATRDGSFDLVIMRLSRCLDTVAPADCHPGAYGNFSSRTLPAAIALVQGQQAIVTVTYTFSAA